MELHPDFVEPLVCLAWLVVIGVGMFLWKLYMGEIL